MAPLNPSQPLAQLPAPAVVQPPRNVLTLLRDKRDYHVETTRQPQPKASKPHESGFSLPRGHPDPFRVSRAFLAVASLPQSPRQSNSSLRLAGAAHSPPSFRPLASPPSLRNATPSHWLGFYSVTADMVLSMEPHEATGGADRILRGLGPPRFVFQRNRHEHVTQNQPQTPRKQAANRAQTIGLRTRS